MSLARPRLGPEAIAFTASFVLLALMVAPAITWMDSGELSASAYTLGGAHPPGHPAHTLVGKLATLVPVGEIGFRTNLLSAFALAAAVAGVVALARALVDTEHVAAAMAGALVACAPVAQINGTRTEVYAPAAALLVWAMVATVRFARAGDDADGRLVLGAALGCSLASAFHPVIAASAAIPMAVSLGWHARARLTRLAPMAICLGGLGLFVYAYLPLRANAATSPLLMWGDPSDLDALWTLVRAPAYQGNFTVDGMGGRFAELVVLCGEGMGAALLLGGLIGLGFGALTGLRGCGIVAAGALVLVIGASTQRALNPDMPGYILPVLLFLAAGLAPVTGAIVRMVPTDWRAENRRHIVAAVVLAPFLVVGSYSPIVRVGDADFRRGDDALQLWSETIDAMPPGPGVYFANSDHSLFTAQYERLVAGGRPDLAIASAQMTRDLWFLEHLRAQLPDIYVPFLDDGTRGNIAERLAVENLRRGRTVGAEVPSFGRFRPIEVRAVGRAYLFAAGANAPVRPPPALAGGVGARVSGFVGLQRAHYEIAGARLAAAAIALGAADRFGDAGMAALAMVPPGDARPALYRFVPRTSRVFIHERWQSALLGDDLAWIAGLSLEPLPRTAAPERVVHRAWQRVLTGELEPGTDELAALGKDADIATGVMLAEVGRSDLAERHVRAFIERRGEDERSLVLLGSVIGNRGTPEALSAAAAAFERAIELAPSSAEPHFRLGQAKLRQGDVEGAQNALIRALRLDPTRKDVERLLRSIRGE